MEHRAHTYFISGNIEFALKDIEYFENRFNKLRKTPEDIVDRGNMLSLKGIILGMSGNIDEAEGIFLENYNIGKQYKNYELFVSSIISLAQVLGLKGKNDIAVKKLKEASTVLRKISEETIKAEFFNNLGSIYHNMGKFQLALGNYRASLEICKNSDIFLLETQVLNNIAFLYDDKNNNRSADKFYKKSIELREKIGYIEGLAITYFNYIIFLMKINEFDKIKKIFSKMLPIVKQLDINSLSVKYNYLFCKYSVIIGKYKDAIPPDNILIGLFKMPPYLKNAIVLLQILFLKKIYKKRLNKVFRLILTIFHKQENENLSYIKIFIHITLKMKPSNLKYIHKRIVILSEKEEDFNRSERLLYGYFRGKYYFYTNDKLNALQILLKITHEILSKGIKELFMLIEIILNDYHNWGKKEEYDKLKEKYMKTLKEYNLGNKSY